MIIIAYLYWGEIRMKRIGALILMLFLFSIIVVFQVSAHEMTFYENDFSVVVSGNVDNGLSGKFATVMLINQKASRDDILPNDLLYLGQTEISQDGNYKFEFGVKKETNTDDYYVKVVCDGQDISSSIERAYVVIDDDTEYKLKIKNNGENFTIEATSDKQNSTCNTFVSFINNQNNVLNTSIIKNSPETFEFSDESDFAKVFLWKDNLRPLMFSRRVSRGAVISSVNVRYPGYTSKALTFSFDDDPASDAKLIEIFNKYGVKGTFNALGTIDKNDPSIYDGHEVVAHGKRHLNMTLDTYTTEECLSDIIDEKAVVKEIFGEGSARGFVWPYTAPIDRDDFETLLQAVRDNYDFCRETPSSGNFKLPEDWHRWAPTCKHDTMYTYLPGFLKYDDDELILFYIWGHAFEFTPDYNGDWSQIEGFLEAIKDKNIWCATNGEIYDYVTKSKNLVINMTNVYNPTDIDIYVELNGVNTVVGPQETIYANSVK